MGTVVVGAPAGRAFTVAGVGFILFGSRNPLQRTNTACASTLGRPPPNSVTAGVSVTHFIEFLRHLEVGAETAPLRACIGAMWDFVQPVPDLHRIQTLTLGMPTNKRFFGRVPFRTDNPSSRACALYGRRKRTFPCASLSLSITRLPTSH